jgi:hypothetical protein
LQQVIEHYTYTGAQYICLAPPKLANDPRTG